MTLIVETGAGLVDAESYVSVADSLTYHANRGNSTWATITTAQQEQALRRATDYMVQKYRLRWKGVRTSATQALDWPRSGVSTEPGAIGYGGLYVVDPNTVPTTIKNVCAELALRAAAGELLSDASQQVLEETIGPIKVKYDQYSPATKRYFAVDAALAPYLSSSGGVSVSLVKG